jgi:hypothetical protein
MIENGEMNMTSALLTMLPIAQLDEVRARVKAEGHKEIRVRFRGPRTQASRIQRQSYCLKRDATHFSVYTQESCERGWEVAQEKWAREHDARRMADDYDPRDEGDLPFDDDAFWEADGAESDI